MRAYDLTITGSLIVSGSTNLTGEFSFGDQIRLAGGSVTEPAIVFTADDDGVVSGLF